jgi:glutamate decarboxylase
VKTAKSRDPEINPIFSREPVRVPRYAMPDGEMEPDTAHQVARDELMLDSHARQNLATFVSTWAEPQARRLMAGCAEKNMIDKEECPRTAGLGTR